MVDSPHRPDLTPYVGRWVALIAGQVAGVGHTAREAEQMARRNRPKERMMLQFVELAGGQPLALSPLLAQLRPLLAQQEMPIYLVGGAVRDAVLGRVSHDLDFVVPEQAISLSFKIADSLGVPAYVLDKERDIGRVMLAEEGTTLDFARFRGADLEADLQDRDFTINALALPAVARTTASIIDPCGGLADLAARRIQLVQEQALAHDPIRALRAVRQALSLDFALTAETEAAIVASIPKLDAVSRERVRDEVLKLMQTAVPHQAVQKLYTLGLLTAVLPEIAALADVAQSPPHHEPVLAHTISVLRWLTVLEAAVLDQAEVSHPLIAVAQAKLAGYRPQLVTHLGQVFDGGPDGRTLLRLGALFHDVGKKETQTVMADGRIRFLGHDQVGAKIAGRRWRRLCLSNQAISHVRQVVKGHMRPLLLANQLAGKAPSRRAVYRFFRALKAAGLDIGLLALADHLATHEAPDEAEWMNLVSLVATLYHYYFEQFTEVVAPPPLLDGRQLMKLLHLSPGPEIGRLLRLLEEAQAVGEVTTVEEAVRFVQRSRQ